MKTLILKPTLFFLTMILTSSLTQARESNEFAVVVPGWDFNEPSPTNPIFNSALKSFKGTISKRGDTLISSLIVLKERLPENIKSPKHLRHWLNANYFEGKAESLYSSEIKGAQDKGQVSVFKDTSHDSLRIVFLYTFIKNNELIILSQESTPETYKEDMAYTVNAFKNLKFIY